MPLVTGAELGIPVVDGDYSGRAVPDEVQGAPFINGFDSHPFLRTRLRPDGESLTTRAFVRSAQVGTAISPGFHKRSRHGRGTAPDGPHGEYGL